MNKVNRRGAITDQNLDLLIKSPSAPGRVSDLLNIFKAIIKKNNKENKRDNFKKYNFFLQLETSNVSTR